MPKVNVEILYYSEDAPGFGAKNDHIISKTFEFENPLPIGCRIKIDDPELSSIPFRNPSYDPKTDTYTVRVSTCEGVSRYYHGSAEHIMDIVMQRYKGNGWKCEKLKEQETR